MAESKLTRMAKLASANPKSWGIVDAVEISGHRSVATVSNLYTLAGCILSASYAGEAKEGTAHTGADAIGQIWYVQDTQKYYKLKSWSDTLSADNWEEVYIGTDYGKVDDVQVNGTSVVADKIANIDLSEYAKTSEVITELTGDKAIKVDGNKISINVIDSSALLNTDSGLEIVLGLEYDSSSKKIKLVGNNGDQIGTDIDASDFIKDGMLDSASYNADDHSLTLTFNTSSGKDPISVDLSDLIDVYDGSNVKLKSITVPDTYSDPVAGDSVDDAFAKLLKKVKTQDDSIENLFERLVAKNYINKEEDGNSITLSADTSVNPEDATETSNSLATSYQVKSYVESKIAWYEA